MNDLLRVLWLSVCLGCLIARPVLAVGGGLAQNGDVVTITADCEYSSGQGDPGSEPASVSIALASPLRDQHPAPVYLARGWEHGGGLAAGITVRAYVFRNGHVELAEGVQLSDGRVMVDGEMLYRAGP
jgi:hypothetical protein